MSAAVRRLPRGSLPRGRLWRLRRLGRLRRLRLGLGLGRRLLPLVGRLRPLLEGEGETGGGGAPCVTVDRRKSSRPGLTRFRPATRIQAAAKVRVLTS